MKKSKSLGQVYTPAWIVRTILDEASYSGSRILEKTVLEPACGDGAFLTEIVYRYIQAAKQEGISTQNIITHLETYIYGIEKEFVAQQKCLENLNKLVNKELGSCTVNWKIYCNDTLLKYQNYLQYFDFIFGNPPYIRIHNLDEKTYIFIKENLLFSNGMIDIYVSFFEIAIKMLKGKGTIGFITPNSFLHNTSYKNFRQFLQHQRYIKILCDFKAHKVFDGFSTYTAITIIDQSQKNNFFIYKELTENKQKITEVNRIEFSNLDDKKWILSNHENSIFLEKLFANTNTSMKELFDIQYGFATLRDKIFIAPPENENSEQIQFNGKWLERGILRKIIKASRYKGNENEIKYIIFPYYKKKKQIPCLF